MIDLLPLISVGCGLNSNGLTGGGSLGSILDGSGSVGACGGEEASDPSFPDVDGSALLSSLSPSPPSFGGPGIGVSPFFKHVWM